MRFARQSHKLPVALFAILALLSAVLAACSDSSQLPPTRIYATIISHNEQSSNLPCAKVVTDQNEYLANRAATLAFAKAVSDAGGTYDLQSEMDYLNQIAQYDTAAVKASSNGKNLVEYLNTFAPGRVQVDAHSHEKLDFGGFNYADVAKQLVDLGVPTSGIVGGCTSNPSTDENWTRFRQPLTALNSDYVWSPTVLWGAASKGHSDDLTASGVWRPKSPDEFFTDDPNGVLTNIGGYVKAVGDDQVQLLADLLSKREAGELQPGHMYTIRLMFKQCEFHTDPSLQASAVAVIEANRQNVTDGKLVWVTLETLIDTWKSDYQGQPTILTR